MGKITAKHYLNTNLKPYETRKGVYLYSLYVQVTANRRNTKVKSTLLSGYYSEQEFEEIIDPTNKEDALSLRLESSMIENTLHFLIEEAGIFDPKLFAAIYRYAADIFVFNIDIQCFKLSNGREVDLFEKDKNNQNLDISELFTKEFSLCDNNANGMSLFTWFSEKGQKELLLYLTENNCSEGTMDILNKIMLCKASKLIGDSYIKNQRRYEILLGKYLDLFEPHFKLEKYYSFFSE